jgi:DNA-binding CsgD family transcriptional regulator
MREGRDFSAEERDLLEVLRPHVGRLLRQADNRVFANVLMSCFGLTRRESEALALLVRGMSTPEIAATLFLSPGTVRKHLEHVYSKLGVTTRAAAAAAAIEACVAPPADGDDWSHGLLGMEDVLSIVGLTRRESDVLALLAAGKRNAEIGSELSLKAETVNKHLDHIYEARRRRPHGGDRPSPPFRPRRASRTRHKLSAGVRRPVSQPVPRS